MNIDIHTTVIFLSLTNLLQVISLFVQYWVNKTKSGLGWWVLGITSGALAFGISYLRDIPTIGLIAIVVNNALFFSAYTLIYVGVLRFFDKHEQRERLMAFCAVFTLIIIYFTYINNDLAVRWVSISIVIATFSFLIARSLLIYRTPSVTISAYFLASVFIINGIFFTVRALMPITGISLGDLFTSSLMQAVTYIIALITSNLLTFGFIIMVNQRLNNENYQAKENLELIFNTSPDAVLITRLTDGYIVAVNDGFTAMSGFTRSGVIGKSAIDINIWGNPADRQELVEDLKEKGFCENMESILLRKDGSQIIGMVSARIIILQETPHIISVARDITRRKEIEAEREKLITELQNALEQIKTLKGIVPICSSCKKIRDDKGFWEQVESYVSKHTEAQFTHGICPDCKKKLFPELI